MFFLSNLHNLFCHFSAKSGYILLSPIMSSLLLLQPSLQCCVCTIIWLKRNARVFNGQFTSAQLLWDRIVFLASLWCHASGSFRGVSLADIREDRDALLS